MSKKGFKVRCYLLCFFCFSFVSLNQLHAAEIISVIGSTNYGGELTVSGSGFGVKSPAKPIKFDDFEWGNIGDSIQTDIVSPTWKAAGSAGSQITATQSHSGARSAYKAMVANNGDCAFYDSFISFPGSLELYISYWIRYDSATGSDLKGPRDDFFKFNRINSGGEPYHGSPSFLINLYPDYNIPETGRIEVHNYWNGGDPGHNIGRLRNNDMRRGEWHRVEMYMRLSAPGGATNGELQWFYDSHEVDTDWSGNTFTPGVTRAEGSTNLIDTFTLMFAGCGYDQVEYPLLWQDDVYIDNTRARVEIGDAAAWADCNHREIQIPTAWSGEQIKVAVKYGSFENLADKYLFVVDADGNVSNGFPLANLENSSGQVAPGVVIDFKRE